MVALLKQKSKVGKKEKTRKTYDVAEVFKVLAREEGKTVYSS